MAYPPAILKGLAVEDVFVEKDATELGLCVKAMYLKDGDGENLERTYRFVASTEDMDADGDIVEQKWDLKRFKQNPVVLFGHNSRELPIGKATDVGVVDGQLEATLILASEKANPLAEQVNQGIKEGTLRAVSVGFRPKEVRHERRNDKDVFVLSDNELFEISVVPIPSNPKALAKMKSLAMQSKEFDLTPPKVLREKSANGGKEGAMDFEKMLEEKSAQLVKLEAAFGAEKAKVETLNQRCKDLEEERNSYKSKADELHKTVVEKQLDDLVGRKITPNERATLLKLAFVDDALFDEHMKAVAERADMPHLKDKVMGTDPTPRELPAAPNGHSGEVLEQLIQQRAFGN